MEAYLVNMTLKEYIFIGETNEIFMEGFDFIGTMLNLKWDINNHEILGYDDEFDFTGYTEKQYDYSTISFEKDE